MLELNIKCSKGGGAKLKGPSPGTAKWRSNEVGEKKEEEKKRKIIDVRRKERDRETDLEDGEGEREGPGVRG